MNDDKDKTDKTKDTTKQKEKISEINIWRDKKKETPIRETSSGCRFY